MTAISCHISRDARNQGQKSVGGGGGVEAAVLVLRGKAGAMVAVSAGGRWGGRRNQI
jgi:hypothetical protein